MYIAIEREKMEFKYKHTDPVVLTNLAWIELRDLSPYIFPLDGIGSLRLFSNMELTILYRNLSGKDPLNTSRLVLQKEVLDLLEEKEPIQVNPFSVDMQAARIKEGDNQNYTFVDNSSRPSVPANVFDPYIEKKVDKKPLIKPSWLK